MNEALLHSSLPLSIPQGVRVCLLSHFSRVRLCGTLRTAACQAPLSMGFSRQVYWSGLPRPPPEDLPDPGITLASLTSPALAGRFFITSATFEAPPQGEDLPFVLLIHPQLSFSKNVKVR